MQKPLVSVIIPVYNEVIYIEQMVQSVLQQRQESFKLELLLVDGASTDGTTEKIIKLKKENPFIQVINNEKRTAPAAFNKGIEAAGGEYIAILGAHSKYDSDYLEICLAELEKNNCIGCSGKVEVAKNDKSAQSIVIYYLLTSSFGVSRKSYRTVKEGVGEQCPYPVFRRCIFNEVGLYNERLVRNQDNDMNYRIRKAGYQLYFTHKVSAYYYPKQILKGILDYAVTTGKWNAVSLKVNPASMGLRHLIPLFFTLSVLGFSAFLLVSFIALPFFIKISVALLMIVVGTHLLCGIVAAFYALLKSKRLLVLVLPIVFFSFHFLYGWGILKGLFDKTASV